MTSNNDINKKYEFNLNPEAMKYAIGLEVKFTIDFLKEVFNDWFKKYNCKFWWLYSSR